MPPNQLCQTLPHVNFLVARLPPGDLSGRPKQKGPDRGEFPIGARILIGRLRLLHSIMTQTGHHVAPNGGTVTIFGTAPRRGSSLLRPISHCLALRPRRTCRSHLNGKLINYSG
jgi:hypothetical protein